MFEEKSFNELSEEIKESKNSWELTQASFWFLNNKLEQLNLSDWILEDYESDIIEKQLEYHIKLQDLADEYEKNNNEITTKNKEKLLWMFVQLENTEISDTQLMQVEWLVENKIFKQERNQFTEVIDIQWWLRWKLDFILNLNDLNNTFVNELVLYFMNNSIELSYNKEGFLDMDSGFLIEILDKFLISNLWWDILPQQLLFNLSSWEFIYNFSERSDILKEKYSEENIYNSLINILNNDFNEGDKISVSEKYNISLDFNNSVELINTLLENEVMTLDDLYTLHDDWKISTGLLLNYLEQEENFNYLDFLENHPLPENVINMTVTFIDKYLDIDNSLMTQEDIIKRTHLLVLLFLSTESDGRNVEHDTLASSASWYFQFLRQLWPGWSIDTGINRLKNVLDQKIFNNKFKWNILNDSRLYSAEDQNLLALWNIFWRWWVENWEFNVNSNVKKHLENFYLHKNIWSLKILYKDYHHTNADSATINRLVLKEKEYWYERWNQLISYIYNWNNKNSTFIAKNDY